MAEPNGTARWQLWVSVATGVLAFIGAIVAFFIQIGALSAKVGEIDARTSILADMSSRVTRLEAHQTEIETQLRAADQVRNLMHAADLRTQAVLWSHAGLGEFPISDAYFPVIADQNTVPTSGRQ